MTGLAYSPEQKATALTKMLPTNNMPLWQLSRAEGISVATLAKWREGARANRTSTVLGHFRRSV